MAADAVAMKIGERFRALSRRWRPVAGFGESLREKGAARVIRELGGQEASRRGVAAKLKDPDGVAWRSMRSRRRAPSRGSRLRRAWPWALAVVAALLLASGVAKAWPFTV